MQFPPDSTVKAKTLRIMNNRILSRKKKDQTKKVWRNASDIGFFISLNCCPRQGVILHVTITASVQMNCAFLRVRGSVLGDNGSDPFDSTIQQ
jgi:hypothetical protein